MYHRRGGGAEKKKLAASGAAFATYPERIHFLPSIPFTEVRHLMREFDIYVMPSNRQERWGTVMNEAMSEGCTLVANEQAVAAKELIIDNETGLLFHDGDEQHLASLLERLGYDYNLRMKIRQKAWERMQALWHPRVGAERLIALSSGLLGITPMQNFMEGPCQNVGITR